MLGMNLLITPFYMGAPRSVVIDLIPTLFFFNFAKALMNSAVAMLLYKPVITALRRAKLIKTRDTFSKAPSKKAGYFNKFTFYTLVISLATLAVAITIFVILRSKA